jgi:hypothetical protein
VTFARVIFVAVFLVLTLGAITVRNAVAPYFRGISESPHHVIAAASTPTRTPTEPASATPTTDPTATATLTPAATKTATPAASSTVAATSIPGATPTATRPARAKHLATPQPSGTPTPTATALPTPTRTAGILTLSNYWIGQLTAAPGQTIEVGYVVANGTGRTAHMVLGASIKPAHALNWATATISDPYHDVVATIRPGVTRHYRFFTLPAGMHSGAYDVAWGLRDPSTGARQSLVFAASVLRIIR